MAETRKSDKSIWSRLFFQASRFGARLRGNWRDHAIAVAAGAFLALVGAFGTLGAPLPSRLVFWISLLAAGSLCASIIQDVTSRRPQLGENRFLTWVLVTTLVAAPMSFFAWGLSRLMFGFGAPSDYLFFLWAAGVISGAMTAMMMLVNTPGFATERARLNEKNDGVRFLTRLPPELKGAKIYAVNAEDHYLRIHSSKGAALILLRLSDAISELSGIEGAQVHRSWWVARDAIQHVQRTRGRVSLALEGGVVAPVSRPNVKALRVSGWI